MELGAWKGIVLMLAQYGTGCLEGYSPNASTVWNWVLGYSPNASTVWNWVLGYSPNASTVWNWVLGRA